MTAPQPTLYIGNRNYSSWSLRAWLLMRQIGLGFETRRLSLFSETFRTTVAAVSPAGRVPVLVDDGFAVWDTLAITEYLAERHPERGVWPDAPRDRARARCICAEMHSGFASLRNAMPMNIEARLPGLGRSPEVDADIARIATMWSELRAQHAARGPFLFGRFSAADAFYAPVVSRFQTHAVALPEPCAAYCGTILALPAMREWTDAALAEHEFIPEDEPYRSAP